MQTLVYLLSYSSFEDVVIFVETLSKFKSDRPSKPANERERNLFNFFCASKNTRKYLIFNQKENNLISLKFFSLHNIIPLGIIYFPLNKEAKILSLSSSN